jgi:hypothetical protein
LNINFTKSISENIWNSFYEHVLIAKKINSIAKIVTTRKILFVFLSSPFLGSDASFEGLVSVSIILFLFINEKDNCLILMFKKIM